MTPNDGSFLRDRAMRFRELGERLVEEETFDLAAFHFQQAAELLLKYCLFTLIGDYPRTHSLKQLLDDYGHASGRVDETESFLNEHIDVISNVENAYITSRYLPGDFRQIEVENMKAWLAILHEFLEEV